LSADFIDLIVWHKLGEFMLNAGVEHRWGLKIAIFEQCIVISRKR